MLPAKTVRVLVLLFSLAASVPSVPCFFSADILETDVISGKTKSYSYQLFMANYTKVAQIGRIPEGYPGVSSILFHNPDRYTFIEPFFDRHVCSTLPIPSSFSCFEIDFDAKLSSTGPCPLDSTKQCEVWKFTDWTDADNTYFLLKGTSTPVRVVWSGQGATITTDFKSFVDKEPDPAVFEVPKDQPCIDLTSATVPMFSMHPHMGSPLALPLASQLVNDPEVVARVSQLARHSSWVASASPFFQGKTFSQARALLRWPSRRAIARPYPQHGSSWNSALPSVIPAEFDARKQWGACIGAIRDQGSCGSCWAFGASEALSDRVCIHGNKTANNPLSPQWMLSCFSNLDACDGGYLDIAWQDLLSMGIVSDKCFPYKAKGTACPSVCTDGSPLSPQKLQRVYSVYVPFNNPQNVETIQADILANGPVESAFWVFSDFMH